MAVSVTVAQADRFERALRPEPAAMLRLPRRTLTPTMAVAGQLQPGDMQAAADQGFQSVINNRPDFEAGPDQPTSAAMEAAATAAGLTYRFLPVASTHQTADEARRFRALLAELPAPILVFCRSGARSTRLHELALQLPD